jgi:hypothetical protein
VTGDHWLTALAPGHQRFSTLVTLKKRAEHTEIFMRELDASTSPEQLALATAEYPGEVTARERDALSALSDGGHALIVLTRDPLAPAADKCPALYRIYTPDGALSMLATVTLPEPFDLQRLLSPAHEAAKPEREASPKLQAVLAPQAEVKPDRVSPWLAILPLGVGQFVEKRPGPAAALLSTQVALLTTNLTAYYVAQQDRQANGTYNHASRAQALQVTTDVAVGLLIVDVVAGAIDGLLRR